MRKLIIDTPDKRSTLDGHVTEHVYRDIACNMPPEPRVAVRIREVGDSELLRACFDAAEIRITSRCPFGDLGYYLGITVCDLTITHHPVRDDRLGEDEIYQYLNRVINNMLVFRYMRLDSVRKIVSSGMVIGLSMVLEGRFTAHRRISARSRLPVGAVTKADFIMFGPHNEVEEHAHSNKDEVALTFKFNDLRPRNEALSRGFALYGLCIQRMDTSIADCSVYVVADIRTADVVVSNVPRTSSYVHRHSAQPAVPQKTAAELLTEVLTDKEHELMVDCLINRAGYLSRLYHIAQGEANYDSMVSTQRVTLSLMQLFDKVFPGGHDILKEALGANLCNATVRMAENEAAGPDQLDIMYDELIQQL